MVLYFFALSSLRTVFRSSAPWAARVAVKRSDMLGRSGSTGYVVILSVSLAFYPTLHVQCPRAP